MTNLILTPASLSLPGAHAAKPKLAAKVFSAAKASTSLKGFAWGIVAAAIWGVYLAFARASVSAGVLPADLDFVRYAVAGLMMLPWLLRHLPGTLAGIGWRRGIVLSLLAGPLFILASALIKANKGTAK